MRRLVLTAPFKLEMTEAPVPEAGKDEVLLRVCRVGVCGSDLTIYRGLHPYVSYPLVMGHEYAGTVEKLGEGVADLSVGQPVAVIPHLVCGRCEACENEIYNFCEELRCTGAEADGAHCDYISAPAKMCVPLPPDMSLDDAALLEPACVAYHGAKRGEVQPDDRVLVVGAGPIGLFLAQSVRALGAKEIYIADLDESRLALARSFGVDGVIAVGKESLVDGLARLAGSPKNIDLFYDCVGERGRVLNDILLLARRGTRVVMVGVLQNEYVLSNLPDFVQHELRLSGTTMYTPADYRDMVRLMSGGTVATRGFVSYRIKLEEFPGLMDRQDKKQGLYYKVIIDMN